MPSSRLLSALGVSAALAMSGCGDDGETALTPDEDLSCVTTADTAGYHRGEAQLNGSADEFLAGLQLEAWDSVQRVWEIYSIEGCIHPVPAVQSGGLSTGKAWISSEAIPNNGITARLLFVPNDQSGVPVTVSTIYYGQDCPASLGPNNLCIKFYCNGGEELAEGTVDPMKIAEMGFWVEPGVSYPVVSCPPTID